MQVWKIVWTDSNGRKQKKFRSSKHSALMRATLAKRQGFKPSVYSVQVPANNKFDLINFLNAEVYEEESA